MQLTNHKRAEDTGTVRFTKPQAQRGIGDSYCAWPITQDYRGGKGQRAWPITRTQGTVRSQPIAGSKSNLIGDRVLDQSQGDTGQGTTRFTNERETPHHRPAMPRLVVIALQHGGALVSGEDSIAHVPRQRFRRRHSAQLPVAHLRHTEEGIRGTGGGWGGGVGGYSIFMHGRSGETIVVLLDPPMPTTSGRMHVGFVLVLCWVFTD